MPGLIPGGVLSPEPDFTALEPLDFIHEKPSDPHSSCVLLDGDFSAHYPIAMRKETRQAAKHPPRPASNPERKRQRQNHQRLRNKNL